MLPSIFLLAKIAMMFVIISTTAIAIKIASKAISNVLEDKENQSTQNKIINLAIGAVSILAGGLSLLITAKVGFIAICSTIAILALYEYIKDEKIGKDINDKFDEIANNTTEFCVNSIEKLIPSQSCEV
ncbi:jg17537 [Pararge aegeria aegeria]|uniref:Jg17537 protein n=2 Tax=cellular organisms TaxID=131567 RepID=A0A8S4QGX9_9NEOP|nr:jg17537 [Pararge aegeria aegeria]